MITDITKQFCLVEIKDSIFLFFGSEIALWSILKQILRFQNVPKSHINAREGGQNDSEDSFAFQKLF